MSNADPAGAASGESPAGRPSGAGDAQEESAGAAEAQDQSTTMSDPQGQPPSEEELRTAYEAEMSRISSADMILQAAVSLLNIGAYRMGSSAAAAAPGAAGGSEQPVGGARDLEQVRDAIDGARALLPILERTHADELRPLRDALSQLQMAYAREVRTPADQTGAQGAQQVPPATAEPDAPGAAAQAQEQPSGPGPAESSGRLWVPGR